MGAVCRYSISQQAIRWWGGHYGWGTLLVNVSGSLVLGLLAGWLQTSESALPPAWRVGISAGFLGAFTTFSTFSVEAIVLARQSWALASVHVATHVLLGLLVAAGGFWIGQHLAGPLN